MTQRQRLFDQAASFINQCYQELDLGGLDERLKIVHAQINELGTYSHTIEELEFGARVAWRNSNRCIGRIFYESLTIFDYRHVTTAQEIFDSTIKYMDFATNNGNIRASIAIFPPKHPEKDGEYRIWNSKLVRFAGYESTDSLRVGDPAEIEFTNVCKSLGWEGKNTDFDLLPFVIQCPDQKPVWFEYPKHVTLTVPLEHPNYTWFEELGLQWYAVPFISDMVLEIGGIHYTAAPFNGWFMETEIGSRNLGDMDRYNLLPVIAQKMELDTYSRSNFWKDRAMIELNQAVLYSYRKAGIRIVDHHTASAQFMKFVKREHEKGRRVTGDWSWLVPPLSGSATEVFHHKYENDVISPNYFYNTPVWKSNLTRKNTERACPFHINSLSPN